jgi:hypothetical protein
MSKTAQYATTEDKVCMEMKEVSFKDTQASLQKTITWTKNYVGTHKTPKVPDWRIFVPNSDISG